MAIVPLSRTAPQEHDEDRYLSADAELERLFRLAWVVIFVLIAGVGGWAGAASISGAVIASGTIVVEGKRKAIQHLDGGVIVRIHVQEGSNVTAGAPLVTLDSGDYRAEIASIASEIAAKSSQIELIEDELKGLRALEAKRLVPRTRVASLQREAASLQGEIARLEGQKAKAQSRLARVELRAPVAGRVHNLSTHTVGGVIAPNATIAEIVPTTDGLVIEAKLSPRDVDQVRAGQDANVRMTSLNQRTTPSLEARVEQISADLFRDDARGGREHYLAKVTLTGDAMRKLQGTTLQPGMPAEVLIETGRRSVLSYLLKPLADQIARAFREE